MPSHSCVANATHDFSTRETGYRMIMRAVVRDGFRAQPPAEFNQVSDLNLGMKFRNNIDDDYERERERALESIGW